MYELDLEKAEESVIKLPFVGSSGKQGKSRKTLGSLTVLKLLTAWITTNCGKFLKRWEYQTILLASWETCMQVKEQQWELDIEQQTGSKLGKKYHKAVCWVRVTQSCLILCDPMDCTVHRILQATILEWIAILFSRRSSQPRDRTQVFLHCRRILYQLSHKGNPRILEWVDYPFSSISSLPRNWTKVSCIADGFFTNWAVRETCHSAYLTYMQSTSCEMEGWMKHKLESRLPGEIKTSDVQMISL